MSVITATVPVLKLGLILTFVIDATPEEIARLRRDHLGGRIVTHETIAAAKRYAATQTDTTSTVCVYA